MVDSTEQKDFWDGTGERRDPTHPAVLAFVEVRYRRQGAMVGAAESIDARKQRKLRTTASHFLATHREHAERVCRFDVVSVSGSEQAPQVDWLEGAFD